MLMRYQREGNRIRAGVPEPEEHWVFFSLLLLMQSDFGVHFRRERRRNVRSSMKRKKS